MDKVLLIENLCKEYLKNFKDGVADALLNGNMADEYSDGYKHGYDFGITIYCQRMEEEQETGRQLLTNELKELVDDLYWDFDRMSSSGQETLDKIADILAIPSPTELKQKNKKEVTK